MPRYNPAEIEPRWQAFWEKHKTFAAPDLPGEKKLYALDMFPYPSGDGLHVGHPEGYTATDIVSRFHRMRGVSVLHPMGFDAFGLPAEEHAIKTNTPPRESTEKNIATFRRQLKSLGFSYDWDREVATTDVDYFHWTQWIFLVLFDTWFDADQQKGRPIAELPIPNEVAGEGDDAVRRYQDDHRLAFQSDALVNWCPVLGTVLANEEIVDGKSERGGHPVERRPLRQWMLRITAYGDRLQDDLTLVNWPESIKTMQRDWIGRSTGAEVDFFIGDADGFDSWKSSRDAFPRKPSDDSLRVYTTRPDTLFGATYMVIAPEHPFVDRLTTAEQQTDVRAYCDRAANRSDRERQEDKEKTGVFTGSFAINPVNGQPTPIWISDYVLINYGTGAIMAVPAHDERDFEFAQKFSLPIIPVVDPGESHEERDEVLAGKACFSGNGHAVNSSTFDGLPTADFKQKITESLHGEETGCKAVNYKLRDWLFSRQRFWGEPFPILHELDDAGNPTGNIRAVDVEELPVDLPHLEDYKPHGKPEPPLGKSPGEWLFVEIDGKRYKRETNTMPQWAGSCWYYLRFIDPKNNQAFIDPVKEKAWMPVDLYIGGAEHAVLHLLYARFWHKVLFDRGYVSTPEPFARLVNQGMILGQPQYQISEEVASSKQEFFDGQDLQTTRVENDEKVSYILQQVEEDHLYDLTEDKTEKRKGKIYLVGTDIELSPKAEKMSKSRGNVVNPDDVIKTHGADTLRMYEMFMGPLEATKPWNMAGVGGIRKFLDRVWRMIVEDEAATATLASDVQDVPLSEDQNRVLHQTIKAVTEDTETLGFNTAIARMMEFLNFFSKQDVRPKEAMESFVLMLAPYAPHIAEELWRALGHAETLTYESWPQYDEAALVESKIELPVQIQGKVKAKIYVAPDLAQDEVLSAALADEKVVAAIDGRQIVKQIVVPGRLVNLVVKP